MPDLQAYETQSYIQRRKVIEGMLAMILVILCATAVVFLSRVSAEGENLVVVQLYNAKRNIQNLSNDLVSTAIQRFGDADTVINTILNDNNVLSFKKTIGMIGIGIVTLHLMLNIIQEAQKAEATMEMWLKIFITMAVGMFMVTNVTTIFETLDKFGEGMFIAFEAQVNENYEARSASDGKNVSETYKQVGCDFKTLVDLFGEDDALLLAGQYETEIGSSADNPRDVEEDDLITEGHVNDYINYEKSDGETVQVRRQYAWQALIDTASKMNFNNVTYTWAISGEKSQMMESVLTALPMVLTAVIDGLIYLLALQISLRTLFAPIAVADISIEGTRSTGMRYMKHYIALYLQKVIILVIVSVGVKVFAAAISGSISNSSTAISYLFLYMTVIGAVTGMMTQAGSLANEIVGD